MRAMHSKGLGLLPPPLLPEQAPRAQGRQGANYQLLELLHWHLCCGNSISTQCVRAWRCVTGEHCPLRVVE